MIVDVLMPRYLKWPDSEAARRDIATRFYSIASVPCVAGLIDGTLIKIVAPSPTVAEPQFVDRKVDFFHSINQ